MIFGINTTHDISKFKKSQNTFNNFEILLVVFMTNITTNHAIFPIILLKNRPAVTYNYNFNTNAVILNNSYFTLEKKITIQTQDVRR